MKIVGKMYQKNKKTTMKEIICHIPNNNKDWYIFEINAVGISPNGMSMQEFESLVLSSEYGYKMTWKELLNFVENIDDIDSLILVSSDRAIAFDLIEYEFNVKIEIYDSKYWEISYV